MSSSHHLPDTSIPFFQTSENNSVDYISDSDQGGQSVSSGTTSKPSVSFLGRLGFPGKRVKSDLETHTGRKLQISINPKNMISLPLTVKEKLSVEDINTLPHRCEPGFQNQGNSCYLSASLQCLLHCNSFVQQIKHHGTHSSGTPHTQFCVLDSLYKLVLTYFDHNAPEVMSLQLFVHNMRRICPFFAPKHQQDADEFIQLLFQALDLVQCNGCADAPLLGGHYPEQIGLILSDSVLGYMKTTITCCSCQQSSTSRASFTKLSVPTRGVENVEAALAAYMSNEVLYGDNSYHCPHCNANSRAVINKEVDEVPNLLILQLNRFDALGKVDVFLPFPLVLDFQQYANVDIDLEKYELVSVLTHHGPSTAFGHYTADVRCSDGHWCHVDDHRRFKITAPIALSNKAYMLFYQKREPLLTMDQVEELESIADVSETSAVQGSQSPVGDTEDSSGANGSVADVIDFGDILENDTVYVISEEDTHAPPRRKHKACCSIS